MTLTHLRAFHRPVIYGCGCPGIVCRDNVDAESIDCQKCSGTARKQKFRLDPPYRTLGGVQVDHAGNIMGWHSERDRNFAHACGE
jgi:hypothetical protein